jgi:hypothetical protein
LQAGLNDGLQAGTTATVDLHAGDGHRQPCVQGHHTSDRGRLARGIAVAENDVLYCTGLDSGALQQTLERGDAEVDGGQ